MRLSECDRAVTQSGNLGINRPEPPNRLSINDAATEDPAAVALIYTDAATNKALVLQGHASQSVDVFQVEASDGTVNVGVRHSGEAFFAGNLGVRRSSPPNTLTVNDAATEDALATALVTADNASRKAMVIQLAASAAQNALEVQSSTGTALLSVGPGGTLNATRGLLVRRQLRTTGVTLTGTDTYVAVDSTAGALTMTLPAASSVGAGHLFILKRVAGGSTVTVAASGADLIDGASTASLAALYDRIGIISNGSNAWERVF